MQNIAIILLMLACLAVLSFLVFISFKLLRDSQTQMKLDKEKKDQKKSVDR